MKDKDGMTPFDHLCRNQSLDEMNPFADISFSMLMIWWYERIGIGLATLDL